MSKNIVSPLRYILEPLGVNVDDFSISVDPMSYTFGDFIGNMANFEPLKSLSQGSCDELAAKSMEALTNNQADIKISMKNSCDKVLYPFEMEELDAISEVSEQIEEEIRLTQRKELRGKVQDYFYEQDCAFCHTPPSQFGAPDMPFDSERMDEFDKYMDQSAGELGDSRLRVWNRITRPPGGPGHMPPGSRKHITAQSREVMKSYLETFVGKNRDEPKKLKFNLGQVVTD
jgi:hypothetical protein